MPFQLLKLAGEETDDQMDGFRAQVGWIENNIFGRAGIELQAFQCDRQGSRIAGPEWRHPRRHHDRIEADGSSESEMNSQAQVERATGGARHCRYVCAIEVDQRQMSFEGSEWRRAVGGMKFSGKAERDPIRGVDGEVGVAARLIAEQRMPGLVCRNVGQLHRRKQGVEHAQEGRALRRRGEDALNIGERISKPVGLQIPLVAEKPDRFPEVQNFVSQAVAHAAPPGEVVSAAPAFRLRVPALAERARGVRLRSVA